MSQLMPTIKLTGLTARELFAKSDRRVAEFYVKDQIKIIDAAITRAHQGGLNYVEHELPVNFPIHNLSKSDAQTLIYSELLMIYKSPEPIGKGFEKVVIDLGPRSVIKLSWLNGLDNEEKTSRQEFIRDCMAPASVYRERF